MIPLLATVASAASGGGPEPLPDAPYAGNGTDSMISASGHYTSYYAMRAFDGDVSSNATQSWLSNSVATWPVTDGSLWLQWDFGSEETITRVRMASRAKATSEQFPSLITIKAGNSPDMSDAVIVADEITLTDPPGTASWCEWALIPNPAAGRYLRIEIIDRYMRGSTTDLVAVNEVEFYAAT